MTRKSSDIRYYGWVRDQSVQRVECQKTAQKNTVCSKAHQSQHSEPWWEAETPPATTLDIQRKRQGITSPFFSHVSFPPPPVNISNACRAALKTGWTNCFLTAVFLPQPLYFQVISIWVDSDMLLQNILFNIHEDHREALNIGLLSQNSHSSTVLPFNEACNWHISMRFVYSAISFLHLGIL